MTPLNIKDVTFRATNRTRNLLVMMDLGEFILEKWCQQFLWSPNGGR